MRRRGFTLTEVLIVGAVGLVLATLAWPSYRGHLLRAGRSEGIEALQRLQLAQERHREMFGTYARDLPRLGAAAHTEGGRYQIELAPLHAEAYVATARVVAAGAQRDDQPCPALTLEVRQGFATLGPHSRCWNR